MKGKNFQEVIDLIVREDGRYDKNAYHFIRQGLDYTQKKVASAHPEKKLRHITGQELSEGLRDFALEQYGPMALTLLNEWGIHRTEDFGEIVFNLVEFEIFGRTDQDSIDDFRNVYPFDEVFKKPFQPKTDAFSSSNHLRS